MERSSFKWVGYSQHCFDRTGYSTELKMNVYTKLLKEVPSKEGPFCSKNSIIKGVNELIKRVCSSSRQC
jgi:hypothetical protein